MHCITPTNLVGYSESKTPKPQHPIILNIPHHIKHKTMHTLFIKTKTETKSIMLNTNALPEKYIDNLVNEWLDSYPDCDWWIDEGYHIKHTPSY